MDWLGENQWAAWLGLSMILTIGELASLDLILEMFAVGALAAMLTSFATDSVAVQVIVFAIASVAMLAVVRPGVVKRLHRGPDLVLGAGALLGKQVVTAQRLSAATPGQIKIEGSYWTALPYDETLVIPAGSTVEILQIKRATAYVHPVATLES
jgi:membrane protein implicated in regulation of membrane protease activity